MQSIHTGAGLVRYTRTGTGYTLRVIRTFRHQGLRLLFRSGDTRKVRADQAERIQDILGHVDAAAHPRDVDLPGYRLHELKGERTGQWSIMVSGNWRIVFRFEAGDAFDVDLLDYH